MQGSMHGDHANAFASVTGMILPDMEARLDRNYGYGVTPRLVDYDRLYDSLKTPPIFVDEFDLDDEESSTKLNSLIVTHYDSDQLSSVASCLCEAVTGESKLGHICSVCNHPVLPATERSLDPVLWLRPPPGISALFHPSIWRLLSRSLTYGKFNFLEYLTNPDFRTQDKIPKEMAILQKLEIPIGLEYFIINYKDILKKLYESKILRGNTNAQRSSKYEFFLSHASITFPTKLPFPSKLAFITEETNGRFVADKRMTPALDAINTLAQLSARSRVPTQRTKERYVVQCIKQLVAYYHEFWKSVLFGKPGMFRKVIFGTRSDMTYRSVIASKHAPHDLRTIQIPWSTAVALLQTHINNKLRKLYWTPNAMMAFCMENVNRYNPIMDSIMKEIISEAKWTGMLGMDGIGMPSLLGRNPTLVRLSMQMFGISGYGTDPTDNTTKISVLALKDPNADFDGDAMNGLIAEDQRKARIFQRYAPHTAAMSLNAPFRVSDNAAIPQQVVGSIANMIKYSDEEYPLTDEIKAELLKLANGDSDEPKHVCV